MNARFRLFFVGFLAAVLALGTGCAKASRDAPPAGTAAAVTGPGTTPSADRAQIVTVSMSLRVGDLLASSEKVRREIEGAGGYVEGSSFSATDDGSSTMDLRVPAAHASATRSALRAMGTVTSESETVQDVTEQRADLDARLRAARTQEDRLLDIMKNKTGSIGDVLESEKELARVRENIEKLEAEQRTMQGQIAMATIHLTLSTPGDAAWRTPGQSVLHAWHAGVRGAQVLATYTAMAVAALLPTLAPIFAILALLILALRRSRAKRTAALVVP